MSAGLSVDPRHRSIQAIMVGALRHQVAERVRVIWRAPVVGGGNASEMATVSSGLEAVIGPRTRSRLMAI